MEEPEAEEPDAFDGVLHNAQEAMEEAQAREEFNQMVDERAKRLRKLHPSLSTFTAEVDTIGGQMAEIADFMTANEKRAGFIVQEYLDLSDRLRTGEIDYGEFVAFFVSLSVETLKMLEAFHDLFDTAKLSGSILAITRSAMTIPYLNDKDDSLKL